jgi:hypothetical protein
MPEALRNQEEPSYIIDNTNYDISNLGPLTTTTRSAAKSGEGRLL